MLLEERAPPKLNAVQSPRISLRNVSTSWNEGSKNVILGASLEVGSNQLVAIVGPVGSGKVSTDSKTFNSLEKVQILES